MSCKSVKCKYSVLAFADWLEVGYFCYGLHFERGVQLLFNREAEFYLWFDDHFVKNILWMCLV